MTQLQTNDGDGLQKLTGICSELNHMIMYKIIVRHVHKWVLLLKSGFIARRGDVALDSLL